MLAAPLTTCLVVLGKHVPGLKFFDVLLGDEPVLSPDVILYQRLGYTTAGRSNSRPCFLTWRCPTSTNGRTSFGTF
jgi:hypothetical protein